MTSYRYPMKSLIGDYIRGGGGLLITGGLLLAATMLTIFQYLFAAAAILFAGFVFRTWQRHQTVFELTDEGLAANGPFGKKLRWAEINEIRLRYFTTRRDRKEGWFQLTVLGDGGKVSIDSSLEGFEALLSRCAETIRRNQLELSDATAENFAAAGFPVRGDTVEGQMPPGDTGVT